MSGHPYRNAAEPTTADGACTCAAWSMDSDLPEGLLPHHPRCPESAGLDAQELGRMLGEWATQYGSADADTVAAAITWAIRHRVETAGNQHADRRTEDAAGVCEALADWYQSKGNAVAANAARACAAGIRAMGGGS